MRDFINIINEHTLAEAGAGASRVVSYIQKGKPFFMISAHRDHFSPEANAKRTEVLKRHLAQLEGCSFITMDGSYREEGAEEASKEASFFVMPRSEKTNTEKFLAVGLKMGHVFDQESIGCGDGDDVYLQFMDGERMNLGNFATFSAENVSKLRGFSTVKNTSFGFTTQDMAPDGVEYGSLKKSA